MQRNSLRIYFESHLCYVLVLQFLKATSQRNGTLKKSRDLRGAVYKRGSICPKSLWLTMHAKK